MPPPTSERRRTRDEAEELAREVTQDAIQAARLGWRIVNRVGRAGLQWAEKMSARVEEELSK